MVTDEQKIELQVLNEGLVIDTFLLYQFIKRLVLPFEEWDAYKHGIIDENGKVLRKRSSLKTKEEKSSFQLWDVLVLNLKKIIGKIPGGKRKLGSFAAALFLIKEGKNYNEDSIAQLCEHFMEFLLKLGADDATINEILAAAERLKIDEVIANSIGAGGVAGLKPGDPDDVVVRRKPKITRRKKLKSFQDYFNSAVK